MDSYGGFEHFTLPGIIVFSLNSKAVVLDMFEFLLVCILSTILIVVLLKKNIFSSYIRIKINIIGLDIDIKNKKSTPQAKIGTLISLNYNFHLIDLKQNKRSKDAFKIFNQLVWIIRTFKTIYSTRCKTYLYQYFL